MWISQLFFPQCKVIRLAFNPRPGGPRPNIYVPPMRGAPVALYDSQGYGEGILTRLHTGQDEDVKYCNCTVWVSDSVAEEKCGYKGR
jgi:hypothetical protein